MQARHRHQTTKFSPMPRPVRPERPKTGDVAGKVFHESSDSVEFLSAFYCRWNLQDDTISAPAVAQRSLFAATVTVANATALAIARRWLAPNPSKPPANATRR